MISDLTAISTTATSTTITWTTDEEADSKLWHSIETPIVVGTSTPSVSSTGLVLSHELVLSDLTTSTTYYYLVTSADSADNTATSSESSVITLSE